MSTPFAHLKGVMSQADLERILDLILDIGLPIYATDYDCCNPNILWTKIRTNGIKHKDDMMYLTVPETNNRAEFLDNISDIDSEMLIEAVLSLRHYADIYIDKMSRGRIDLIKLVFRQAVII